MMRNKLLFHWFLAACLCFALTGCFQNKTVTSPTTLPITEPALPLQTNAPTEFAESTEPQILPSESAVYHETDFVLVKDFIPDISVELKYATEDNFTGIVIYDFQDAYLRYGTVLKLMAVQEELDGMGLSLKIWDGFRPVTAQWKLWEAYPDPNYVSHPQTGGRTHCRGNTVDVTLVDKSGNELEMPTGFDDFSEMADRDYSDCTDRAAGNSRVLQYVMEKHGFRGIQSEWWHYVDEEDYPVEEQFVPITRSLWYADCQEYINLRKEPHIEAESLRQIPAGHEFHVLGWYDRFALAEYQGIRGYVNRDYIARK